MKESRILLAAICLAFGLSLFAQGDFRPGYIINLQQDTIYGQVKSQNESRNAGICIFRTGADGEESLFQPGEISAYRITDGKYYVSMTLVEEGVQKQVFLEYLVNGMADLYFLRGDNSETYYIRKEGGEALAITDIRLLKAAFSDCFEIQPSIDKATLNHKSMVDLTLKYHDYVSVGEESINYSKLASRLRIQVGPVAGYSMYSLTFQGAALFESFEFERSQAPVLGLVLDLGSDRLGQHLSFQLGVEYSKYSLQTYAEADATEYYMDYYTYDVQLESSLLNLMLGTKYAFPGYRIRPFIAGGLMFSKFVNPDFSYTETAYYINWDPMVESNTWSENPMAGLMYGAYVQTGLDVKLSEKLTLVSAIKGGYLSSNPNTIMALQQRQTDQMRVRTQLIPVSIHIGILF